MKTSFRLVLTVLACLAAPALARAEEPKTAKVAYSALEIARFDVNREDYSSKEAERAGKISDEFLDGIQRALLGEMTRSSLFPAVRKPLAHESKTRVSFVHHPARSAGLCGGRRSTNAGNTAAAGDKARGRDD